MKNVMNTSVGLMKRKTMTKIKPIINNSTLLTVNKIEEPEL